jgi:hypothetical protein
MVWVDTVFSSHLHTYELVYERGENGINAQGPMVPDVAQGKDDESVWLKASAPFSVPSPRTALARRSPTKLPGQDITRPANEDRLEILGIPPSANAGQYPKNRVFKTQGGLLLEMDDTPGSERWQLHHPSGTSIEVGAGGTFTQRMVKQWEEVLETRTTRIGGDDRICTDGSRLEAVNVNSVEDVKQRKVILASEIDLQSRFDFIMEVGSHFFSNVRGYQTFRSGSDTRITAGRELTLTGLVSATMTGALSASVTALAGPLTLLAPGAILLNSTLGAVAITAGTAVNVTAGGAFAVQSAGTATFTAPSVNLVGAVACGEPLSAVPVLKATPDLLAALTMAFTTAGVAGGAATLAAATSAALRAT